MTAVLWRARTNTRADSGSDPQRGRSATFTCGVVRCPPLGVMVVVGLMSLCAWCVAEEPRLDRATEPIDPAATRKVSVAREFLAAKQWSNAIDLIGQLARSDARALVRIAPDRCVPGRVAARVLLRSLGAEGLAVYRQRVDPAAKARYAEARESGDRELLEQLVGDQFASSVTDDALWLLGELAFEDGDFVAAREAWRMLVPSTAFATSPDEPVIPPAYEVYPDPQFALADVRARLILCSIHSGELDRAGRELARYRADHGEARGRLAGQDGLWIDLLSAELTLADETESQATNRTDGALAGLLNSGCRTLGETADRTGLGSAAPDVGAPVWSAFWPKSFAFPEGAGIGPRRSGPVAPYHVVVANDLVFGCDEQSVFAWKLRSGQPAWGENNPAAGAVGDVPGPPGAAAEPARRPPHELFVLTGEGQGVPLFRDRMMLAGRPTFSVTVDSGRLYARLGEITKGRVAQPIPASYLVCLDVGEGEGKFLWASEPRDLDPTSADWVFEGSPVAEGARLYIGLRQPGAKPKAAIACVSAETGKVVWFREVVTAGPEWQSVEGQPILEVTHEPLTLADDRVFYTTHLGVVVALAAGTGDWLWSWSYPRETAETVGEYGLRKRYAPSPAVYRHGRLFVAPSDAGAIYCLDGKTGLKLWGSEHLGRVRSLLGADSQRLIASGPDLWALDLDTGKSLWRHSATDPSDEAFGRGCLAGTQVLWPLRDRILAFDRATGRQERLWPLLPRGISEGGNLVTAGGLLLISTPSRLYAVGDQPGRAPLTKETAARETVIPKTGEPVGRPRQRSSLSPVVWQKDMPVMKTPRGAFLNQAWEIERDAASRFELIRGEPDEGEATGASASDREALVELSRGVERIDLKTGATQWFLPTVGAPDSVTVTREGWLVRTPRAALVVDGVTGQLLQTKSRDSEGALGSDRGVPPGRVRQRFPIGTNSSHGRELVALRWPDELVELGAGAMPSRWSGVSPDDVVDATPLAWSTQGRVTWGLVTQSGAAWSVRPGEPRPIAYRGVVSNARAAAYWLPVESALEEPTPNTSLPAEDVGYLVKDGTQLAAVRLVSGEELWSREIGYGPALPRDSVRRFPGRAISPAYRTSASKTGNVSGKTRGATDSVQATAVEDATSAGARGDVILAVRNGIVSGWRAATGERLFDRVVGTTDSTWRIVWESHEPVVARTNGDLAEFWRLDAATGRPVQRITPPFPPGTIRWQATEQGAVLLGQHTASGWITALGK